MIIVHLIISLFLLFVLVWIVGGFLTIVIYETFNEMKCGRLMHNGILYLFFSFYIFKKENRKKYICSKCF